MRAEYLERSGPMRVDQSVIVLVVWEAALCTTYHRVITERGGDLRPADTAPWERSGLHADVEERGWSGQERSQQESLHGQQQELGLLLRAPGGHGGGGGGGGEVGSLTAGG